MAYTDLRTDTRPNSWTFEYPLGVPISGVDVRDAVGPTFHFREWANEAGMRRNDDDMPGLESTLSIAEDLTDHLGWQLRMGEFMDDERIAFPTLKHSEVTTQTGQAVRATFGGRIPNLMLMDREGRVLVNSAPPVRSAS